MKNAVKRIFVFAKFRFDTAENEPAKILQILQKTYANFANLILVLPEQEPHRSARFVEAELAMNISEAKYERVRGYEHQVAHYFSLLSALGAQLLRWR